ncbi:MAG: hypothetical protein BWK79_08715 [Beggiatoa sp. IS2]|nr:MAG: hypothetical protein BWK79_08715 [Beggiatoa sp. IS2]
MATSRRTENLTLAEQLLTETYRFEFYQGVKLIEQIINGPLPESDELSEELFETIKCFRKLAGITLPMGDSREPSHDRVHFRSAVKMDFPASDVEALFPPTVVQQQPILEVNFMGLAGAHGPLPPPYTELIRERVWHGDTTLRDFLDVFNNRLISLLYKARQRQRIGLEVRMPWDSEFARHLLMLLGLGTSRLQSRMQIEDHALLFYTGLFVHQARSLSALENLLRDFFQIQVVSEPCLGQWWNLPEEEYTHLGISGQNQILGQTALIGTRVWAQQSKFALHLGPIGLVQFLDFLPIGWGFMPLCELTHLWVGPELDFEITLTLKAKEIPETYLSTQKGGRLGWTSWLKVKEFKKDAQIRLLPHLVIGKKEKYSFSLLGLLPEDELRVVLNQMTVHDLPRHTIVVKQETMGDSLFLIQNGSVQVLREEQDGSQRILGNLKEGDFFGEMALLTGRPRSATVVTTTDCKILELSKRQLTDLMQKYPRIEQMLQTYYKRRVSQ